jgi:PAS domain S-box-containing protein
MFVMLADLFKDASLLPHGYCLLWDPWLISAHLFSDIAIFLAYAAIPVAIYMFLRKRPTLAMSNLAWLFALFILFCGITHLASAVALYLPIYEMQAGIKVVTAGVSLATAFVIFPLIPKALAIPSPDDLQRVISQLQTEVESHQQTAHELRTARDELQQRVQEQTTALARASSVIAALDESASILIFVKDNDGKMLMANPAAIAATGRTAEEVIGKADSEFLNQPEESEKIREVDRQVRETGLPVKAAEKVTRPDGTVRVYLSTKVPLRNSKGAVEGIVGVSVDISDREALLEKLTRSEENLRLGSEAASFGSCEFSPAEQQLHVSQSLQRMLGLSQETVTLDDFLGAVILEDRLAVSEALHTQTAAEIEFRSRGQDGTACWYLLRGQNRSTDGVARFWGAIVDITRRKRAEHRTGDLMRELIHRGRNLLTVVQVLARNSLTPPRTLAEARDIFIERLHAFARGYELFVDGDHVGLTFRDLILAEANRFPGQFDLSGPEFLLNERAAQTLGLVIHELTTNAAKYGALSKPTGQVRLEWTVDESGMLKFGWHEMGGPATSAPTKKGFGTGLIERILKTDFSARPHWEFAPEGYHFTFEAPLSKLRADAVGPGGTLQESLAM